MTLNWKSLMIVVRVVRTFKYRLIRFNTIVCTSKLRIKPTHRSIPLEKLARITLNSKYSVENIPAVQYRFSGPVSMTMSLYHTGSLIHCGGNYMCHKLRNVQRVIDEFASKIDIVDDTFEPKIVVVNTMTTIKIPFLIDLNKLLLENPLNTVYLRELFPGCKFILAEHKGRSDVCAVVFHSGSVNLCGCLSTGEVIKYRSYLREFLLNYRFQD